MTGQATVSATAILTVTANPALDVTAWVTRWEPQVKLYSDRIRRDPGGGGVNVARMAARWLGPDRVKPLLALGGETGARHRRALEAEGLAPTVVPIAEETRESWQISLSGRGFYRIVHPGPRWREDEAAAFAEAVRREAARRRPQWVVFSGSLPDGMAPATLAQMITAVRRLRPAARVAVDTRGPALAAALEAGVDLVKPDRREMAELAARLGHGAAAPLALARRMIAAGRAGIFCYTLGAEGLVTVTRARAWQWKPPPVEPVSLAGAGDFLLGTLIARLVAGDPLMAAGRLAIAAAAATAGTEGTSPPEPSAVTTSARSCRLIALDEQAAG